MCAQGFEADETYPFGNFEYMGCILKGGALSFYPSFIIAAKHQRFRLKFSSIGKLCGAAHQRIVE